MLKNKASKIRNPNIDYVAISLITSFAHYCSLLFSSDFGVCLVIELYTSPNNKKKNIAVQAPAKENPLVKEKTKIVIMIKKTYSGDPCIISIVGFKSLTMMAKNTTKNKRTMIKINTLTTCCVSAETSLIKKRLRNFSKKPIKGSQKISTVSGEFPIIFSPF